MPALRERMRRFIRERDTDTLEDVFIRKVETFFAARYPHMGIWVAVGDDHVLIGHAIIIIERVSQEQEPFALVWQVELDKPNRKLVLSAWGEIQDWIHSLNVNQIKAVASRRGEGMFRRFGFDDKRIVLSKNLRSPQWAEAGRRSPQQQSPQN